LVPGPQQELLVNFMSMVLINLGVNQDIKDSSAAIRPWFAEKSISPSLKKLH